MHKITKNNVSLGITLTSLLISVITYGGAKGQSKLASPVVAQESVTVTATPIPTVKPIPTDIRGYIKYKFGEIDGERAIKMLEDCENRDLGLTRINWNGNGSYDYGLFQINSIHGYTKEQLSDSKFNTDVAYKLYKSAGYSFRPWTCAYVIGDEPFWK